MWFVTTKIISITMIFLSFKLFVQSTWVHFIGLRKLYPVNVIQCETIFLRYLRILFIPKFKKKMNFFHSLVVQCVGLINELGSLIKVVFVFFT